MSFPARQTARLYSPGPYLIVAMKKLISTYIVTFAVIFSPAVAAQQGCKETNMLKPTPFLGTANEIIMLADGSIWEDISYKYLYLYAYNPKVIICPAQGRMLVDAGGTTHSFTVMRIK